MAAFQGQPPCPLCLLVLYLVWCHVGARECHVWILTRASVTGRNRVTEPFLRFLRLGKSLVLVGARIMAVLTMQPVLVYKILQQITENPK